MCNESRRDIRGGEVQDGTIDAVPYIYIYTTNISSLVLFIRICAKCTYIIHTILPPVGLCLCYTVYQSFILGGCSFLAGISCCVCGSITAKNCQSNIYDSLIKSHCWNSAQFQWILYLRCKSNSSFGKSKTKISTNTAAANSSPLGFWPIRPLQFAEACLVTIGIITFIPGVLKTTTAICDVVQWWFQPCCTADDQLLVKDIESQQPWWKWSILCSLSVKQHTLQAFFMFLYKWKKTSWSKYANELWDRFLRSNHCWYTNAFVCLMTSHSSFDVCAAVCLPMKNKPMAWNSEPNFAPYI